MKTTFVIVILFLSSFEAFAQSRRLGVEPLMGVMTSMQGVSIQAHSSGCTDKRSFTVQKERSGDVTELTFIRVEEDPCMALLMFGKILSYSYDELGIEKGEEFIVNNPLGISQAR